MNVQLVPLDDLWRRYGICSHPDCELPIAGYTINGPQLCGGHLTGYNVLGDRPYVLAPDVQLCAGCYGRGCAMCGELGVLYPLK